MRRYRLVSFVLACIGAAPVTHSATAMPLESDRFCTVKGDAAKLGFENLETIRQAITLSKCLAGDKIVVRNVQIVPYLVAAEVCHFSNQILTGGRVGDGFGADLTCTYTGTLRTERNR